MNGTLVYNDSDTQVYWNGSATFNVFSSNEEIDCFTVYGVTNSSDAIWEARNWIDDFYMGQLYSDLADSDRHHVITKEDYDNARS
tara:strand:- start:1744 stop:1998 length:255 start_codon:yes stop_codon:yes gene_type:complete